MADERTREEIDQDNLIQNAAGDLWGAGHKPHGVNEYGSVILAGYEAEAGPALGVVRVEHKMPECALDDPNRLSLEETFAARSTAAAEYAAALRSAGWVVGEKVVGGNRPILLARVPVECPRHSAAGVECYPAIPDLADRIECAIGLGPGGAEGVKATARTILAIFEDHQAQLADQRALDRSWPSKARIARLLREAGHQECAFHGRGHRSTPGFRVSRNDAILPGPVVLYLNSDDEETTDFRAATLAVYAATLRELGYTAEVVVPEALGIEVVSVSGRKAVGLRLFAD